MDEFLDVIAEINRRLALNASRKLLTPGPLTTRYSVKQAMLTDHCTWDDEYKEVTTSVMNDITQISANDDYATVLLQGSGSYAVEAMINCLCGEREKILFLVNGEYGKRMLTIADNSRRDYEVLTFDMTQPVGVDMVDKKLKADAEIKTVVFVHCETTTGVLNPPVDITKLAKSYGKKVLVDAMSSFAAYEIDMPGLDIDALAASSNKCLEGLPGLSFVIVKKTLLEASKGKSLSHSLDLFDQYQGLYAGGGKFRFTSPTNILLALRQAIDEYKKEGGLPARRTRYMENHRVLTKGLAELGIRSIVAPEDQSYIITTFDLGDFDFSELYATLKAKGFIIYPGKLTATPTFRLGNIGDVYPSDMAGLVRAVGEYIVFGRVTPDQKRKLVRALKAAGHTVAMTGDGVNDVLALKDANCSIAMASGSEVASQVSDIVLLDSDFSSMPAVVMEGRRVINNLERSASLFITKNIFSFLFATVMTIALAHSFPLEPLHFTLFNMMLIGAPSFVLALEPNKSIVRGRFMVNVFLNALPAGLACYAGLTALVVVCGRRGIPDHETSTMALLLIAFVGFLMLYKLCRPFNNVRIALIVCMAVGFTLGSFALGWMTVLAPLRGDSIWITVIICIAAAPVFFALTLLANYFSRKSKTAMKSSR
jgi:2-aminoethylphosphonate-pyruvate transaminase